VRNNQLYGPLLLLQHWSWSHLPVNRPVIPLPHPRWAVPDLDRCPAYGAIWGRDHEHEEKGKGISNVRGQLQMLRDENIDWFPYRAWYQRRWLSRLTLEQAMVLSVTGRLFLDSGVSLPRSGVSTVWLGCFHPGAPAEGQE
jgi:hypothetical protein